MYIRFLAVVWALGLGINAYAQSATTYPTDYFRNPLGIPIMLAGNFGECRPNHFHSGIDIKTNGKENLPVYAAADGYISRIKMERGGFGHALYITHPNGYTTLYAHLNNFMPAVQQYMKNGQYDKESWEVDLYPGADQFPVKKGQQIALSGNTGGSTAPHLHFEIRNTKTEHPLNPQLFGFDITDNIAPKPTQIAVYDLSSSLYEQRPRILPLRSRGTDYGVGGDTIKMDSPLAGIGVNVNDYMNGSTNTLNFYKATVQMDDEPQAIILLEDIGYEETRYLHAYADYKTRKTNGSWIQCLFRLPGNQLQHVYPLLNEQRGALNISDGRPHHVRIALEDTKGNVSNIAFYLLGNSEKRKENCDRQYVVNQSNIFEHPNVKLSLDDKALYDNFCFTFSKAADANSYSDNYRIHKADVPVHTYFDLSIKPNKPVPFASRDKVAMIYSDGKEESGKAAIQDSGWYTAKVRSFGNYKLVEDAEPPSLKAGQPNGANLSKASSIVFQAADKITSVKKFRAELNGKWLCFEQKGNSFVYTFDEHCPKGNHTLVVTATDENNNTQTLRYNFTR